MGRERKISYPLGMFDLAKGVAVVLVLMHHTITIAEVNRTLYIVVETINLALMGIFFAASGFGFREMDMKAALKKYGALYLKPYAIVGVIITIFYPIIRFLLQSENGFRLKDSGRYILTYLLGIFYENKVIMGMKAYTIWICWFLLAMFWSSMFINTAQKIKKKSIRYAFVIALMILGSLLDSHEWDYLGFSRGCISVAAMYFGYQVKENELLAQKSIWITVLALTLVGWSLVYMGTTSNTRIYLFWIGRMLLECAFGYFAAWISYCTLAIENCMTESLRTIGRYSFWFVCVHAVEMTCIQWWRLALLFEGKPNFCFWVVLLLRGGIIAVGCWLLNFINIKIRRYKRNLKRRRGK